MAFEKSGPCFLKIAVDAVKMAKSLLLWISSRETSNVNCALSGLTTVDCEFVIAFEATGVAVKLGRTGWGDVRTGNANKFTAKTIKYIARLFIRDSAIYGDAPN